MKQLFMLGLLALGLVASGPQAAQAQAQPLPYNEVDQLPQLPSGGGKDSLEAVLVRNFHYPANILPTQVNGSIDIDAVVTQTGQMTTVTFSRSSSSARIPVAVEEAIRAAFHRLPPLTPGQLAGRAVAVKLEVGWSFLLSRPGKSTVMRVRISSNGKGDLPDLSGLGSDDSPVGAIPVSDPVYTYVEDMPHLENTKGLAPIITAIEQKLVVPANAKEGRVFVRFVVTKEGAISEPSIAVGLDPISDAAVLAAVKGLPTFVPGRQNGKLVRVVFTLPVVVRRPGK
jgi:outer membrane biosynthesis protein TonB